jgi:DNA/RNA endonuclease G (NUC1)
VYELVLLLLSAACPATLAHRQDFTVCYDSANQRPLWTIHRPQHSASPSTRRAWRTDHQLNSRSTTDFSNSGFHRGHLVAAADLPESPDTFLTSNRSIRHGRGNHVPINFLINLTHSV